MSLPNYITLHEILVWFLLIDVVKRIDYWRLLLRLLENTRDYYRDYWRILEITIEITREY